MTRQTIASRVLEELRRSSRPLDDDELAARLYVQPRQFINQVCRRLERSGQLRRRPGPDGKIVNDIHPAASEPARPTAAPPSPAARRAAAGSGSATEPGAARPGHRVTAADLAKAGFEPLKLHVTSTDVELPAGRRCEWTTLGEVPDSPGLYAFTVEDDNQIRVTYVGRTSHLWMITKGTLPGGGPRGGQRYGRPRHAGTTRQRVNLLIADHLRAGHQIRHWVRPLAAAALHAEEERLITFWDLRRTGWNRG